MKLISNSAIVTGGGQGIGLGIAARLLRDGANVLLFGRTAAKVEAAAEALNRATEGRTRALAFAGDVSAPRTWRAASRQRRPRSGCPASS
jgi:3-oxoacyl-[acyl-carrier protein] reductase